MLLCVLPLLAGQSDRPAIERLDQFWLVSFEGDPLRSAQVDGHNVAKSVHAGVVLTPWRQAVIVRTRNLAGGCVCAEEMETERERLTERARQTERETERERWAFDHEDSTSSGYVHVHTCAYT